MVELILCDNLLEILIMYNVHDVICFQYSYEFILLNRKILNFPACT